MVGDSKIEEKVKKMTEEKNTSQLEMTMEKVGEINVEMVEEKRPKETILDVFEDIPKHTTQKFVEEMIDMEIMNEVFHKFVDIQGRGVGIHVIFQDLGHMSPPVAILDVEVPTPQGV